MAKVAGSPSNQQPPSITTKAAAGQQRLRGPMFVGLTMLIAALVLFPIGSLVWTALTGTPDSLGHIARYVLPFTISTTFWLMLGVIVGTGVIGTFSAWLVMTFRFPGARLFLWALVLPLAVPSYLSAYAFVEFFSFTGPLQESLRAVTGFESARQYWFPSIRNTGGAVLVLSVVFYPYVFLAVVALLKLQGNRLVEASRALGQGPFGTLVRVLLPALRPAIAAGVVLALMETLNDIGAVEYLGVETLTFTIFDTWLSRRDIAGAAQLTMVLLIFVYMLVLTERWARRRQQARRGSSERAGPPRQQLRGVWALLAILWCSLPVLLGFGVPLWVLGGYAVDRLDLLTDADLHRALLTSLQLALGAAALTVLAGVIMVYTLRLQAGPHRGLHLIVRFASLGYAVPGTILALGLFVPLAALDNLLAGWLRMGLGFSVGLLFTGSGALILLAYLIRFLALAEGNIDGGFRNIPLARDDASRTLGQGGLMTLLRVHLPALWPSLSVAALLVFIEALKELSATIFLRPFGLNTLSTFIYDFASRARVEETGVACLIIVLLGVVPVILVSRRIAQEPR
ncbi:MAG: iron ABC transporter permease [Kiloniella sp.]|nr:iron ABC transporter permease [Kiloniella sp.]